MTNMENLLKTVDFSVNPSKLKKKKLNRVLDFISSGKTLNFETAVNKKLHVNWIYFLLCDPRGSSHLSNKGLAINYATITEELNMEGLTLDRCIDLDNCTFENEVNFNSVKIGSLMLQGAHLNCGLSLISAQIGGQLNCRGASIRKVNGSSEAVIAQNAIINGSVLFDSKDNSCQFKSFGGIDFYGANIKGTLKCQYSSFKDSDDYSLQIEQAIVGGDVIIENEKDSFLINGISIQETTINGSLYFNNLKIEIEDNSSWAINAKRVNVSGDVVFGEHFQSTGEVKFCGAQIGGQLKCRGAKFNKPSNINASDGDVRSCAFVAKGLRLGGPLFMDQKFTAEGEVNLVNAHIKGVFDCTDGTFNNQYGIALSIERARIDGDVFFSGYLKNNRVIESKVNDRFFATGEVNLCGAKISGMLNCKNGRFLNAQNNIGENDKRVYAIRAIGISVKGPLFLSEGCEVKGSVSLLNANIDAILDFCGGEFGDNQGIAINAERVTVKGDLLFRNKNMANQNDCREKFSASGSINLNKADIGKGFIYHDNCKNWIPDIILSGARINTMDVNQTVWEKLDNKNLHDCIYNSISPSVPDTYEKCKNKNKNKNKWIRNNAPGNCSPQPYRQLAKVLDEMGYEKAAKEVRVEMNDQILGKICSQKKEQGKSYTVDDNKLSFYQKIPDLIYKKWLILSKHLIGYGYKPFLTLNYAIIIVLLGALFFHIGFDRGIMHADYRGIIGSEAGFQDDAYQPKFSAFVYSLDVFLPIVNLNQVEHWKPQPKSDYLNTANQERLVTHYASFSFWLKLWMYFQILSGWFLVTLLIGGLSGLIREK